MVHEVYLVGIGLGNPATMTSEARDAIARSDLLIGATRMVAPFANAGARTRALIRADDIAEALMQEEADVASVLFSGDVGFYSGATILARKLRGIGGMSVRAVAGISSLVYLCARLITPWQDAFLVSAHGRECDPVDAVSSHAKTFFLTGGSTRAQDVCTALDGAGLGKLRVHVGERLSYDDERIVSATAAELARKEFDDLSVLLVINDALAPDSPGKLVTS